MSLCRLPGSGGRLHNRRRVSRTSIFRCRTDSTSTGAIAKEAHAGCSGRLIGMVRHDEVNTFYNAGHLLLKDVMSWPAGDSAVCSLHGRSFNGRSCYGRPAGLGISLVLRGTFGRECRHQKQYGAAKKKGPFHDLNSFGECLDYRRKRSNSVPATAKVSPKNTGISGRRVKLHSFKLFKATFPLSFFRKIGRRRTRNLPGVPVG